ncbi:NADH dehydrogenase [ubiquinone] 1 subunit C2 [Neocloeon triangulifer]|uniref:NADH dehydrogenase [ubiquinone] 1 subunit C2 n=1 Tax=Neocloeon triangulifer TaxID=2078957 RepID=UPI00286F8AF9|nr:NADH dehydrogenase [ubiquinone] 1 subunit C2 [Neocloeon triangulifer]
MERKTALELLEPSNRDDLNVLYKTWGVVAGTVLGIASAVWMNWASYKPAYSGAPRSLLIIAAFGGAGKYLQDYRDRKLAERDAILRHYITLHPEDFELPPRVKYADVFQKWIPVR